MSNYFRCDVCGRETYGCNVVNGMKFCAKCYQETFGKDNQQNEIQQIKQQLEEKDKEIHSLIVDYEKRISQEQELMSNLEKELAELKEKDNYHLRYELAGADETITNLKKQLEEKTKEIERLKVFEKAYYYNQLQASQEDIQKFQNLVNQSAVNINYIAIQELEKVKDLITHFCDIHSDEYYGVKSQVKGIEQNVCESIDNQIKVLKGE